MSATDIRLSGQYVNIEQARVLAGVTRRTIYKWMNAGKRVYVRTADGQVRILRDSLDRVNTR